jgi:uncharacterized protein YjbI with pentapeptide repeats
MIALSLTVAALSICETAAANNTPTCISGKAPGPDIDCDGSDLRGADLSGLDLSNISLRKADLRDADLSGVDLSRADLEGADLMGADLSAARLTLTNLSGTDLRGADLGGAKLSLATLRLANLVGANLTGTVMKHTILRDAKVGTSLKNALITCTICPNGKVSKSARCRRPNIWATRQNKAQDRGNKGGSSDTQSPSKSRRR